MKRISLYLEEEEVEELRLWAKGKGYGSMSTAMRVCFKQALARMPLTKAQREEVEKEEGDV